MTQLTNEAFRALLQNILDTKAASVIDLTVGDLATFSIFVSQEGTPEPTTRQEEILYQIYLVDSLDVKWLIAAYHLRDDEQYRAISQWLIQKRRTNTIPDLGEPYSFDLGPTQDAEDGA